MLKHSIHYLIRRDLGGPATDEGASVSLEARVMSKDTLHNTVELSAIVMENTLLNNSRVIEISRLIRDR